MADLCELFLKQVLRGKANDSLSSRMKRLLGVCDQFSFYYEVHPVDQLHIELWVFWVGLVIFFVQHCESLLTTTDAGYTSHTLLMAKNVILTFCQWFLSMGGQTQAMESQGLT